MQNIDVNEANPPALHFEPGRFVEIDRGRADERSAVVVNDVFLACIDEAKTSAKRKMRPVGRCAYDVAPGQINTEGIATASSFGVGISGRAHFLHALAGNRRNESRLCLGRTTGEHRERTDYECKVKVSGHLQ